MVLSKFYCKIILSISVLIFLTGTLTGKAAQVCPGDQSSVDCIKKRGRIIAGVKYDAKLFGYGTGSDNVTGFDIDLLRAFAKCWLGDETSVDFIRVTSKDRIRMLKERKIDLVAATMTHTKEREELIDFSQTYFLDGQRLLVNTTSNVGKDIEAEESFESFKNKLNGKTVAAIKGSTSIRNIEKKAGEFGITITLKPFRTYDKAIEALNRQEADYVTTDGGILSGFARDNPDLKVVGAPFSAEPYGIGAYKGDSDFRKLINVTLQALMATGEYEKMYKKWFPNWSLYEIEVFPGKTDFSPFECSWLINLPEIPIPEPKVSQLPVPAAIPESKILYTIKKSDTLSRIAQKFYGNGSKESYMRIYNHNNNKTATINGDPNKIKIGEVLKIPKLQK